MDSPGAQAHRNPDKHARAGAEHQYLMAGIADLDNRALQPVARLTV